MYVARLWGYLASTAWNVPPSNDQYIHRLELTMVDGGMDAATWVSTVRPGNREDSYGMITVQPMLYIVGWKMYGGLKLANAPMTYGQRGWRLYGPR